MISIKKKDNVSSIPKYNSHCGLSRENWNQLNASKTIKIDNIPELALDYVEEIKAKKGK
jgi:hypothetical protein